jgi:hypothetical protein
VNLAERTDAELQAASGRCYLRGAVGLLEHAVVLLAHVPAEELVPVPELAGRLEYALGFLQRGEAPPAAHPTVEPTQEGALW